MLSGVDGGTSPDCHPFQRRGDRCQLVEQLCCRRRGVFPGLVGGGASVACLAEVALLVVPIRSLVGGAGAAHCEHDPSFEGDSDGGHYFFPFGLLVGATRP